MPKPTRESPTRQILFRLTEAEYDTLCGMAYLQGVSPTEVARQQLAAVLIGWAELPRVDRVVRERHEYEAEIAGKLAVLPDRTKDARD